MKPLFCISLLLVLLLGDQVFGISSTDKLNIDAGIKAINSLNRYSKTKNFNSLVASLTQNAKSIMNAVSSLVKVKKSRVSGFSSTPALPASVYSSGYEEVKRLIDWSKVQITYGTYERSIKACARQLREISDAPDNAIEAQIKLFMVKYESDYRNSALKIWEGVVHHSSVSQNIMVAARAYTQEDRKKVQSFGTGVTQLIMEGVEIEIAYAEMKTGNPNSVRQTWASRTSTLRNKLSSVDIQVRNAFGSQHPKDYVTLTHRHGGANHNDFRTHVYNHMATKYYWRRFFVHVQTYDKGFMLAASHCAGGYHQRGKSFVVYASIDNSVNIFTQAKAKQLVDSSGVGNHDKATAIRDVLRSRGGGCNNYALVHVVCMNCGNGQLTWTSWGHKRYERRFDAKNRKKFMVWLFG